MQAISPVTTTNLLTKVQNTLYKLEVYDGASWIDLCNLSSENYVTSISVTPSGSGATPEVIAGSWSAELSDPTGVFHPLNPSATYGTLLRVGRKVRISIGATYSSTAYYWQRLIGYMDAPSFDHKARTISLSGCDYSKTLADYQLRSPDNYWGTSTTLSSVETDKTYGTSIYVEADAADPIDDNNSVSAWSVAYGTVTSVTAGPGFDSDYAVQFTKDTSHTWASINTDEIGTVAQGTIYEFQFTYRRTTGSGTLAAYLYETSSPYAAMGQVTSLSSDSVVTIKLRFVGTHDGGVQVNFKITDTLSGTSAFRIDDIYVRTVVANSNTRYPLPDGCNGPYYVTLDGTPYWYGNSDNQWFYDESNNVFYFGDKVFIETGASNLIVYYYTTQDVEDVVADILSDAGLYATGADALAAMDYTATGETIDRVWFEAGTSALGAIRMLCERVNYRFWFDYNGVPTFQPVPDAAATSMSFASMGYISGMSVGQDLSKIRNRIVIQGIEQGMYSVNEDKRSSRLVSTATYDSSSIAAYLEHTETITNHLFQDQTSIDAIASEMLDELKSPKWYAEIEFPHMVAPLEVGDTIDFYASFQPGGSAYQFFGIIRGMELNNGTTTLNCEVHFTSLLTANCAVSSAAGNIALFQAQRLASMGACALELSATSPTLAAGSLLTLSNAAHGMTSDNVTLHATLVYTYTPASNDIDVTIPSWATHAIIECWGPGGAGGGVGEGYHGGGGGGGSYAYIDQSVTGGGSIHIYIGAGSTGAATYAVYSTVIVCMAVCGQDGTVDGGGTGGQASSSTGSTKYSGGNGYYTAAGYVGGGGGSSAGTGSNGNSATSQSGALAVTGGGAGGNGGSRYNNGEDGNTPGGGGGGAGDDLSNPLTPGDGGDGRLRITYYN